MPDSLVVLTAVVSGVASKIDFKVGLEQDPPIDLALCYIMRLKCTSVRRMLKLSRKKSMLWGTSYAGSGKDKEK